MGVDLTVKLVVRGQGTVTPPAAPAADAPVATPEG